MPKIIDKMATYKKFLIQQQSYDGSTYSNIGSMVDTQARFRIACQEFPFKDLPDIKELPKRDWHDENGDDVYIPTDGFKFKAYDVDATFIYVGTESSIRSDIKNFIDFLYGRIDSSGNSRSGGVVLAIYDEYTQTGRRGVIVNSVDNTLYWNVDYDPDAIATFKVKFHVADPVTRLNSSLNAV